MSGAVTGALGAVLGTTPEPDPIQPEPVRNPEDNADDIALRRIRAESRRRGVDTLAVRPSGPSQPTEGTGLSV